MRAAIRLSPPAGLPARKEGACPPPPRPTTPPRTPSPARHPGPGRPLIGPSRRRRPIPGGPRGPARRRRDRRRVGLRAAPAAAARPWPPPPPQGGRPGLALDPRAAPATAARRGRGSCAASGCHPRPSGACGRRRGRMAGAHRGRRPRSAGPMRSWPCWGPCRTRSWRPGSAGRRRRCGSVATAWAFRRPHTVDRRPAAPSRVPPPAARPPIHSAPCLLLAPGPYWKT